MSDDGLSYLPLKTLSSKIELGAALSKSEDKVS